jgi:acyl-CoA synthetase (AMP-forming)/AMP-acid ligase II
MGSIGILLPNLEARLVTDENGEVDAEEGQPGELWLRGPSVMKGYLNNKAATEAAITPDGWFKTGDIATRDAEGFYYIVDRRKELIKYKGFQVPPAELESVLLTHPDIADAAVIGVNSATQATELPRAYVVHAKPNAISLEQNKSAFCRNIERWIQEKVAKHKYLRGGVIVVDIIPKSAAGKILRRELRERAKQELAGRDPAERYIDAKL